ncbi:MAG: DUF5780 domain-containing protein [Maledivibacter sp.]|jgi:tetratricopeptide (TPR) repeat protein|nr:DUF5780 domain-containing protein [Maledivibacter sp.]
MFCRKCGKEIRDHSLFCNYCGENQKEIDNNIKGKNEIVLSHKKIIILSLAGLFIVGGIFFSIKFITNPVNKFVNAVKDSKYTEAISLYNEKIKGDLEKENEIEKKLKNQIEEILNDFKTKEVGYDESILALESIKKTKLLVSETDKGLKEVKELHTSRVAYKKGLKFKEAKKYGDAVSELNKVIEADGDYGNAQEEIKSIIGEYKTDIVNQIEASGKSKNYEKALKIIKEALLIIPNDADLLVKEATYTKLNDEKKAEEHRVKMEELKSNQEVEVISTRQYTDSINTNFIAVKVRNNTSNKRVKSYTIGFMAFDADGLPVKVGLVGENFVGRGRADQNILPNKVKDSGGGWYLDNHNIKTLIACINEVEYYENNEKWENPYYDVWLEEYKEKPLH